MTPEQLETAARHACKLLDINPDMLTSSVDSNGIIRTYWQLFVPKIREAWAIQEAIRYVASQAQAKAFDASVGNQDVFGASVAPQNAGAFPVQTSAVPRSASGLL